MYSDVVVILRSAVRYHISERPPVDARSVDHFRTYVPNGRPEKAVKIAEWKSYREIFSGYGLRTGRTVGTFGTYSVPYRTVTTQQDHKRRYVAPPLHLAQGSTISLPPPFPAPS